MNDRETRWLAADAHRGALLRVALRRTNAADAEDAVSEAILRAGLDDRIDIERLWPWLVTTTQRICVDLHRGRPREKVLAHYFAISDHPAVDPAETVCDRAEAAWLAGTAQNLPPRQKAVLAMRADGMSTPNVAQHLGLSYKAVESLTSRARTALRIAFQATLGGLGVWKLRRGSRGLLATTATASFLAAGVILAAVGELAGPVTSLTPVPAVKPVRTHRLEFRSTTVGDSLLPSPTRPPTGPKPTEAPLQVTEQIWLGPAGVSSVQVERKDTDESLAESVQRCLEHGVVVSTQQIGCADG